jgi:HD domain
MHVRAVAGKAENLRLMVGEDADLLVAAAWLHDIGYSPSVVETGFHPLDGARFLRGLGADGRLCGLVAHHSAARYDARLRNLGRELAEFHDDRSLVRDALWYCDMTTGPTGVTVTFDERLAELWQRYGPDHVVPRAIGMASGEVRAAIGRVLDRVSLLDPELGQRTAPRSPAR